jgi:hypothetical protein
VCQSITIKHLRSVLSFGAIEQLVPCSVGPQHPRHPPTSPVIMANVSLAEDADGEVSARRIGRLPPRAQDVPCLDQSFNGVIGWTRQDSKPNNALLILTDDRDTGQRGHSEGKIPTLIAIQIVLVIRARLGQWRQLRLYER